MKFIYILYKTVRTETGEYYIGVHGINTVEFPDFNDRYLGSGIRILASEKKYGRKAFVRSILSISESRDVVLALEAAMVTVEMIADPLCLNLAPGGRAGVKGVPNLKLKGRPSWRRGITLSADHCQAISDAKKGYKHSAKSCQKMSESHKGVSTGPHSEKTKQKSKRR